MAEKAETSSTKGKRGRPPVNPVAEVNQKTVTDNIQHDYEVNAYRSTSILSSYYFGMNIFDYYSAEQLAALVRDPMANNQILRELSLILYGCNGVYTNTVDYMTAMPTLDKVVAVTGSNDRKKKSNKEKMESTLRTIKHKEVVRDALFKGMIEGIGFYYFETTSRPLSREKYLSDFDVQQISEINDLGINASIISLPADYTKIVGIKNSSYVIAFDLSYFDNCESEDKERKLRKYPKEIRDAYNRNNGANSNKWVALDNTKTIVHKIRSKRDEPWGRPLVLAAINDILYGDYFTDTKRNVLDDINNRIIYQTFPEGKEKGTSALTQKQQQNQHDKVKGAVMQKNNKGGISFFSVAAGTKIDSIDANNTDIFDEKYESNLTDKIATSLGFAASLLNGTGSGTYSSQENNLDLISSQLFMWIDQIEAELNKCINANIIKDYKNYTEVKYLPITNVNKKNMVAFAKDLYLQGKGSLALWASACGISPDVFFALLDQEKAEDIENKYPVHQTSYTYSGNDGAGRPTDEDSQNPNTLKSRANNANAQPSPGE